MGIDISSLGPAARAQVLSKLSPEDRKLAENSGKSSKYHSRKAKRDSIEFDSKKEANRFDELMAMLRAGEIKNLKLQHTFTLQESYVTPDGERIRAIKYVADFSYLRLDLYGNWHPVVEDVKSKATRTPQYIMKRKMMQEKFGITVQEI